MFWRPGLYGAGCAGRPKPGPEDKDIASDLTLFWSLPDFMPVGFDDMDVAKGMEGREVVDSPLDKEDMEAVADRGGRPRPPIVTS